MVGYAQLEQPDAGHAEVELVVHPDHRRAGVGDALLQAVQELAASRPLRIWAHGDLPGTKAWAEREGYVPVRGLWMMRRELSEPLPDLVVPDGIVIRSFLPGSDEEAWLAVNARAFASHPEQGGWAASDLDARINEPWFDPSGFLLAEDSTTGELLGFHWTKVAGGVGEVYVVGVDPSAQGRRLGGALTLAGLHHLRDQGLSEVELYVESDNEPALRVYSGLGFVHVSTDVMYERQP